MIIRIPVLSTKGKLQRYIMARKRKNGPREANGKPSRAKSPRSNAVKESADAEPLRLRAKVFGLSPKDAKDQKAGSFIGRLNIAYQNNKEAPEGLTTRQYEAGVRYLEVRNLYLRQIGASEAVYEFNGYGSMTDTPAEQAKRWEQIKQRWDAIRQSIQIKQNESAGNLFAAIQYCVVEDNSLFYMIGDLRLALNAVADYFDKGKLRKAA